MFIKAEEKRPFRGLSIPCGSLKGISKKLELLISEIERGSGKPIVFADKRYIPELERRLAAYHLRPTHHWVFLAPNRCFESDVAHELIHAKLISIDGFPRWTARVSKIASNIPPELTAEAKELLSLLDSFVLDLLVDEIVKEMGFSTKRSHRRDTKRYYGTIKAGNAYQEWDEAIRTVYAAVDYVIFFLSEPNDTFKWALQEREDIKKLFEKPFPQAAKLGHDLKRIVDQHGYRTPSEYKASFEAVLKRVLPLLGIYLESTR